MMCEIKSKKNFRLFSLFLATFGFLKCHINRMGTKDEKENEKNE